MIDKLKYFTKNLLIINLEQTGNYFDKLLASKALFVISL